MMNEEKQQSTGLLEKMERDLIIDCFAGGADRE